MSLKSQLAPPPSKKMKLESSHSPFILENDKLTKSLLDPFPFPDNFTPEMKPSPQQYTFVCTKLVETYPILEDNYGKEGVKIVS